ncbi:capZ-interacting protein-like [Esox lucius]|uniref:capZ-interacting protein-like n=1 Tax=Esox lucius TaxID=8010 RepID=UPI001476D43D|nr:capZ-interacting protein-like [Esox lucius]
MPSHKSPGLRLLPPSFSPVSPCSPTLPVTMVNPTSPVSRVPRARSQSKEEIPTTFENPAKPTEGSLLPSINKGRARLSIRRRPPSRRHRKSSGEEDGGAAESDTPLSPNNTPDSVGEDEKKEGGEVFQNKHKNEEETDNTPKADTEPISVTSTNSQQQPVTDGTTTDIDLLNKTKTGSFLEPQREENQERKTGAERQTGATESRGEGKACGQGCGEEKMRRGYSVVQYSERTRSQIQKREKSWPAKRERQRGIQIKMKRRDMDKVVDEYLELISRLLQLQLAMFGANYTYQTSSDVANIILEMLPEVRGLFGQVEALVRLQLVVPASSVEAERSFSALRRLKTWLRSSMTQTRLNNVAMCHIHQEKLDRLDLEEICQSFIGVNDKCKKAFGSFARRGDGRIGEQRKGEELTGKQGRGDDWRRRKI